MPSYKDALSEQRSFSGLAAPQLEADSRSISGLAVVYETPSAVLYDLREGRHFTEVIHRGAITPELLASSDVLALYEHQTDKLLARSTQGEGSLELRLQEDGLHYRFDSPTTQLGEDVLELLRRGDLRASSFAFGLKRGDDRWEEQPDGSWIRHIDHISYIGDVSIVAHPAYSATSVSARSLAEVKEAQTPKPPHKLSTLEQAALALLGD